MEVGLRFVPMDLHIHTPASHDFYPRDGSVTADLIVAKAIERGLAAIAITDHNTGDWIDSVKSAAEGTSLTVYPGVEVLSTGGKSGIHIIGIFDTSKDTDHITALLGKLDIPPENFGTQKAVSPHSPAHVIKAIAEEPFCGIAVLAHCSSSKGVLADMRGETRSRIFEEPGLLGVETSENDFVNKERAEKTNTCHRFVRWN